MICIKHIIDFISKQRIIKSICIWSFSLRTKTLRMQDCMWRKIWRYSKNIFGIPELNFAAEIFEFLSSWKQHNSNSSKGDYIIKTIKNFGKTKFHLKPKIFNRVKIDVKRPVCPLYGLTCPALDNQSIFRFSWNRKIDTVRIEQTTGRLTSTLIYFFFLLFP